MPRRPPVALLAALVAACSTPTPHARTVQVPPAAGLDPAARAACAHLVAGLPARLQTASRRPTVPDDATTAAWGDPPITLVCGGASGSALDEPFSVDGIRWALHEVGGARSWTTLDRSPALRVVLPESYQNQAELIGLLTAPLR